MIIAGTKVPVIFLRDLIKMKAMTGRPRDLEDVEHLEKIINMKKGE